MNKVARVLSEVRRMGAVGQELEAKAAVRQDARSFAQVRPQGRRG